MPFSRFVTSGFVFVSAVLLARPVSQPHGGITTGTRGPASLGAEYSAGLANYSKCPFLRRPMGTDEKPDWALEAFGIGIFQKQLAAFKPNYQTNQLAVIDTGSSVKSPNVLGSPGDPVGHGTAVVSMANLVNPKVIIRPYRVKYQDPEKEYKGMGFDSAQLMNRFIEAIQDPNISVINLSLSAPAGSPLGILTEEAIRAGKWVVFAGGNNHSVNGPKTSGALRNLDPAAAHSVFSVGSFSPYGPAAHSNFGGIDFFAPGAQVTVQGKVLDGTSFAAPFFASILSSLRAAANEKDFTAAMAMRLLKRTAIERGKEGTQAEQVNPVLALQILTEAKKIGPSASECLSSSACLKEAESRTAVLVQQLKDEARLAERNLAKDTKGTDCQSAQNYYELLQRGYHLEKGTGFFAQNIAGFLNSANNPLFAEHYYFADSMAPQNLDIKLAGNPSPDAIHARRFYAGDLKPIYGRKGGEHLSTPEFLSRLPATPENALPYQDRCADFLMEVRNDPWCKEYLLQAPPEFLAALSQNERDRNITSATPGNDEGEPKPSVAAPLEIVHKFVPTLTRIRLEKRWPVDTSEQTFAAWFVPTRVHPAIGRLRLALWKNELKLASDADILKALKALLALTSTSKNSPRLYQTLVENKALPILSWTLLSALENQPGFAKLLGFMLTAQPEYFSSLAEIAEVPEVLWAIALNSPSEKMVPFLSLAHTRLDITHPDFADELSNLADSRELAHD